MSSFAWTSGPAERIEYKVVAHDYADESKIECVPTTDRAYAGRQAAGLAAPGVKVEILTRHLIATDWKVIEGE